MKRCSCVLVLIGLLLGLVGCSGTSSNTESDVSQTLDASASSVAAVSSENETDLVESTQQTSSREELISSNKESKPVSSKPISSNPLFSSDTPTSSVGKTSSTAPKPPAPKLSASKQLAGLFDGTVTETVDYSLAGAGFSMHFPDMVWVNDTIYAYYISYPQSTGGKAAIGLAVSYDGEIFAEVNNAVICPGKDDWDFRMASFPGVWYEDGTFYVVYESSPRKGGANIALATSTDGKKFTKQGVILYMDKTLKWQNYNIGTPDLYKKDGIWYLTFHGCGSEKKGDCQIGLAYGKDLYHLEMLPEPILPTSDNPDDPDSGTTGRRDVIYDKESGYFYMVYEVSTDPLPEVSFAGSRWGHMFARSRDMKTWEKAGPCYSTTTQGFGYDGPNFLLYEGQAFVYMRNLSNCTTKLSLTAR